MRWTGSGVLAVACLLVVAATARADGWSPPIFAAEGPGVTDVEGGFERQYDGRGVVAWLQDGVAWVRSRDGYGVWGPPERLSAAGETASELEIAFEQDYAQVQAAVAFVTGGTRVHVAVRERGATSFSPTE